MQNAFDPSLTRRAMIPGAAIDFTPYLDRAREAFRTGSMAAAEAIVRAVVTLEPRHANALSLLGVIQDRNGAHEAAVDSLRAALAVRDGAAFRTNLGMALGKLNRWQEAAAEHRQALALRPDYPQALNNLGVALERLGELDEAREAYGQAIALAPDWAEPWINFGLLLRTLGAHDKAISCFDRALALRPDDTGALLQSGVALAEAGAADRAAERFARASRLNPSNADALSNLGLALQQLGRFEEAEAEYRRALALNPDHVEALNNLGSLLRALDRLEEAIAVLLHAIALRTGYADALNNLAVALHDAGRIEEALATVESVLAANPHDADAWHHKAMLQLMRGEFRAGWQAYEWRTRTRQARGAVRDTDAPLWRGEAADGRTILLHAEQGHGDTLQFIRYAPMVARRGLRLVIEVQPALKRLVEGSAALHLPPGTIVLAQGESLPRFDLQAPLLSLPRAFATELETVPAEIPYLSTDETAVARWRARLAELPGRKVGLVWAGGQRPNLPHTVVIDRRRSMRLAQFAPLGNIPGLSFVSLQKGPPEKETLETPEGLALHDFTRELHDFADTAALVAALDLVIGVDTAVMHLAGAMGRPVWLLNRFDTCWRWLRDRDDSPWYPSLRQFRQTAPGDWAGVIDRVRAALAAFPAGLIPGAPSFEQEGLATRWQEAQVLEAA
jgi:tetratricopeptide (TPR) repeat protein